MSAGLREPDLWDLLQAPRREFANRPLFSSSRGGWTHEAAYSAAERLAAALETQGVRPERPTALSLPNGPAFLPVLLALLKLGTPVALVSPRYSQSELQAIVAGAGVRVLLTLASHAAKVSALLNRADAHHLETGDAGEPLAIVRVAELEPSAARREAAAVLKFTSGSTGQPKGIALATANVASEARNIVETLALTPEDRILADVPLVHSYGFDLGILAALFSGACLTVQDYFVPRRIPQDLERERTTVFLGVPHMYRRWLEAAPPAAMPIPSIRYLLSCTAPLDVETIRAFHARFRLPICQHYGSSEAGGVTNHVPEEVLDLPGSVGRALHNVQVRVLDETGREVPTGCEGELVVASAALARGYVMGAPEDRQPFRDGAFWTGDLATLDTAGFVHLRGRLDDLFNVGGLKVSPQEVRHVLVSHPAVREAAVGGAPDGAGDVQVSALVAVSSHVDEKELRAYCYARLADYKVPKRIRFVADLPRGVSGKVRLRPGDL